MDTIERGGGGIAPLPEGFTLDTPSGAPMPPSAGGAPPLPEGFTLDRPQTAAPVPQQAGPPPPKGFTLDDTPPPKGSPEQMQTEPVPKPLGTAQEQHAQDALDTEKDSPGFMQIVGSAAGRKAVEATTNLMLGSQIVLPKGVGGQSLEDAYQEGKMHPKTKDTIDELLEKPISQGWGDWRWWTAQLAGNLGGVAPGLTAAGAATAVAGPIAGIGGFAGEAAIERLVPAYNAARAAGLDPDQATKQALVDSGISAAFAVGMGLVGKFPLTGTIAKEVNGEVVNLLKRPVMEAFLQLSAVQPGLMAGQDIATSLSHGEAPNAEQLVTDMLVGGLAGYGIHRTFRTLDQVKGLIGRGSEEGSSAASDETIMQAAEAQRPKSLHEQIARLGEGSEPAAPVGPPGGPSDDSELTRRAMLEPGSAALETELRPKEPNPVFYSQVAKVLSEKMPANASPEQVLGILNNSGVSEEQKERAFIPSYLEDQRGTINKNDLLAHVEANMLRVKERHYTDVAQEADAALEAFWAQKQAEGKMQPSDLSPQEREQFRALKGAYMEARARPPLEHDEPYNYLPGEQRGRTELLMYMDDPLEVEARNWAKKNEIDWDKLNAGARTRAYRMVQEDAKAEGRTIPEAYVDLMHWPSVPNSIVHTRGEARTGPLGEKTYVTDEIQATGHQDAAKEGYKGERFRDPKDIEREIKGTRDPVRLRTLSNELRKARLSDAERSVPMELPFKTDHQELAIKRLMRWAVDSGFDELALVNGDMVGLRLNSAKQLEGARLNYDKKLPAIMKKWAKKLGTTLEYRKLDDVTPEAAAKLFPMGAAIRMSKYREMGLVGQKPFNQHILVMKLTPEASGIIRSGLPYETELHPKGSVRTLSDIVQENKMPGRLARAAGKIDQFIRKTSSELGVSRGITFNALPMDTAWRGRVRDGFDPATGNYIIDVNTKRILTEHDLYSAMSHEFGHVVMHNLFLTAPDAEKATLFAAFRDFRSKFDPNNALVGDVRRLRDNAISLSTGARSMHDGLRLSDLDPRSKAYFLSFEEWFSEQTAKWMQTDAHPLGVADGFFKRLANKIKKMLGVFQKADPQAGTPTQAMTDFLNSRWGMPGGWIEPIKEQFERDTTKTAQAAFDKEGAPETKAVPQQASTGGGRDIVKNLGLGKEGGDAMAAHADRMNWFYDLTLSLPQVQELNQHLRQLGLYTDMHRIANWENNEIMREAHQRVQQWGMIRDPKQQLALTKFINDYANGLFKLPHTEDGIFRRPNAEEFSALVKKHGLTDQAVKLFRGITDDFDKFLEKYRTLLINDARRIKDPDRQRVNIENINMQIDKLTKRPFIPLTRFGKYLVTVYDSKGNIRHSEQTNSLRRQRQIVDALKAHSDRLPGDIVLPGMVPKDAAPFLGMPPGLIDLIADKLTLSQTQKGILDQLRFDYAPGHSFKHQFSELDLVPGYSTDFLRNYAHFFFHGARHVTRIKWVDAMRDQIKSLASDSERKARAGNTDGANKLDKVVKYMQKHFDAWVDPKSDWAGLRGMMFHWYLGFNPASAAVNLTQSPLMTYPYLASQYGDIKAVKSMMKASLDLNNFYKKGTLVSKGDVSKNTAENFVARALGELVKRGTISETQAHQLAAISEDRNLLRNFGKKGEAGWLKFQEASSWMFEMTEQYNRRLAARAALDLAYSHPDHKEVRTAVAESPILFKELTDPKGMNWSAQEAGAFLAAQRAVNKTQFEYAQYARPRLMRGPVGGTAFVFKLFAQNTLFNLLSNPAMLARWMVVMGALGGLQGLMGFENVNSLMKTLAYRLFGKDFDLEDEARGFAHDVLHDAISPDILMHGLSAKGFGIPAVMHSMGANWMPTLDMSKSVGFGDIIGFDPFRPLGPTKNPKEEELRQGTRAVGAAFGLPLSIYDFATSNQNFTDLKKYEAIAPRFLGNLSHAFRWATEGKEVNASGNAVVRFNVSDTEQMMEILARAAGFQPRRLTEEWARIAATTDASNFWDLRRQGLMRQFAETIRTKDPDNKQRVIEAIRKFNKELPEFARTKTITSSQLQSSVQQRLRVQQMQEAGMPAQKSNVPIAREVEKYYPRGWPKDLQTVKPVQ
jgi:hypothetical protein